MPLSSRSSVALTSSLNSLNEDEFTTAMRVSDKYRIPIRLADAAQNETLANLNQLISFELFNLIELFKGMVNLVSRSS